MNPEQGTELRSGKIISSSSETSIPTNPDMAQSSANDSDSNETSDISSQLSEIKESYERKINELQNEFSQLKDLMMAVISKTDSENRPSTSKGPSKPAHTVGLDTPFAPSQRLLIFSLFFKLFKNITLINNMSTSRCEIERYVTESSTKSPNATCVYKLHFYCSSLKLGASSTIFIHLVCTTYKQYTLPVMKAAILTKFFPSFAKKNHMMRSISPTQ